MSGQGGFADRAHRALHDAQLRANFRRAMDGLMTKRRAVFDDQEELEALRDLGAAIRRDALAGLPDLLEKLEENCTANGIQVHWAQTIQEANEIVLEIARQHDAKRIIKGKSMVSEEMHLNDFMARHGIECLESDLGEYIIQLDHEMPSHIIMPAIHKNRDQIAHLFEREVERGHYTEDVDELTAMARRKLREAFMSADIGLSGVNFAVAETGTLCLVENEGNGRMCTTVPPVHVAVMGIEKVVERLSDVPPLLSLLTRSATGQPITTYFNMITSPRRPGERDGPKEVHLVLLDNGRSRIYADPDLRQTLQCIRCGACMNHCPVYGRIGGHAYDAVYPGPIGKILTPQLEGLDAAGELATASTLCGACGEVCPVRIPIPRILVRLRREAVEPPAGSPVPGAGSRRRGLEAWIWRRWSALHANPERYRFFTSLGVRFGRFLPNIGALKAWCSVRSRPRPAPKTLHQMARERRIANE
ncbi:MAG: LutB/LldF family L-lactate oxidation iron-sulfur protein [Gammaproteobacteria bacterium]